MCLQAMINLSNRVFPAQTKRGDNHIFAGRIPSDCAPVNHQEGITGKQFCNYLKIVSSADIMHKI
jgi:hypothetical protein